MIATMSTVIYQLLLTNTSVSILKYLSAYIKNRYNHIEKLKQKHFSSDVLSSLQQLLYCCYNWIMPFKKVSQDLQKSIYKLAQNQLNILNQCRYEHEITQCLSSTVWILKNSFKISNNEITHARDCFYSIRISNELTDLNIKEKLKILQNIHNIDVN